MVEDITTLYGFIREIKSCECFLSLRLSLILSCYALKVVTGHNLSFGGKTRKKNSTIFLLPGLLCQFSWNKGYTFRAVLETLCV